MTLSLCNDICIVLNVSTEEWRIIDQPLENNLMASCSLTRLFVKKKTSTGHRSYNNKANVKTIEILSVD